MIERTDDIGKANGAIYTLGEPISPLFRRGEMKTMIPTRTGKKRAKNYGKEERKTIQLVGVSSTKNILPKPSPSRAGKRRRRVKGARLVQGGRGGKFNRREGKA